MCSGCWAEAGAPVVDTPAVREAARLVAALFEHSAVGGTAHVVVDDWNLEDEHLEWCMGQSVAGSPEAKCLDALRLLGPAERASALALQAGLWGGRP